MLHRHDTTTDAGLGDLRLVERDDGRGNADGNTRDDTADDEHASVLDGGAQCQLVHMMGKEVPKGASPKLPVSRDLRMQPRRSAAAYLPRSQLPSGAPDDAERVLAARRERRVHNTGRDTYNGGALEDRADDPDPAGKDNGPLAAEEVGKLGDGEGTDEGAGGHGGHDGSLGIGTRVAEGVLVGVIGQDAGHGRDVQSEETTADTCERT